VSHNADSTLSLSTAVIKPDMVIVAMAYDARQPSGPCTSVRALQRLQIIYVLIIGAPKVAPVSVRDVTTTIKCIMRYIQTVP